MPYESKIKEAIDCLSEEEKLKLLEKLTELSKEHKTFDKLQDGDLLVDYNNHKLSYAKIDKTNNLITLYTGEKGNLKEFCETYDSFWKNLRLVRFESEVMNP